MSLLLLALGTLQAPAWATAWRAGKPRTQASAESQKSSCHLKGRCRGPWGPLGEPRQRVFSVWLWGLRVPQLMSPTLRGVVQKRAFISSDSACHQAWPAVCQPQCR